MSVEDTVVAEAMSTMYRKTPLSDYSLGPVNQNNYGGNGSYADKVLDIASRRNDKSVEKNDAKSLVQEMYNAAVNPIYN